MEHEVVNSRQEFICKIIHESTRDLDLCASYLLLKIIEHRISKPIEEFETIVGDDVVVGVDERIKRMVGG